MQPLQKFFTPILISLKNYITIIPTFMFLVKMKQKYFILLLMEITKAKLSLLIWELKLLVYLLIEKSIFF